MKEKTAYEVSDSIKLILDQIEFKDFTPSKELSAENAEEVILTDNVEEEKPNS